MKSNPESFLHSSTYTPLSRAEFRHLFQIDSPRFTTTTGEKALKHPLLGSTRANFLGLEIGAGQDLEDPFTMLTEFTSFEGPNHEAVAYGEYTKYDLSGLSSRYVFMAIIERTLDPDIPEAEIKGTDEDFIHFPHMAFYGMIRFVKGEERIEPLAMNVSLGYDAEAFPVTAELQGNEELGRGLCYADAVLCQIMAAQKIEIGDNIRWIQGVDITEVQQKIDRMKIRTYEDLALQIAAAQSSSPENTVATGPVI